MIRTKSWYVGCMLAVLFLNGCGISEFAEQGNPNAAKDASSPADTRGPGDGMPSATENPGSTATPVPTTLPTSIPTQSPSATPTPSNPGLPILADDFSFGSNPIGYRFGVSPVFAAVDAFLAQENGKLQFGGYTDTVVAGRLSRKLAQVATIEGNASPVVATLVGGSVTSLAHSESSGRTYATVSWDLLADRKMRVWALDPTGRTDTSFGTDGTGTVSSAFPAGWSTAMTLVLKDDKLRVFGGVGTAENLTDYSFAVVTMSTDGRLLSHSALPAKGFATRAADAGAHGVLVAGQGPSGIHVFLLDAEDSPVSAFAGGRLDFPVNPSAKVILGGLTTDGRSSAYLVWGESSGSALRLVLSKFAIASGEIEDVTSIATASATSVKDLVVSPEGLVVVALADYSVLFGDIESGFRILPGVIGFVGAARLSFSPSQQKLTLGGGHEGTKGWAARRLVLQ